MFFIIRFAITWLIWWLLADKKRWRELLACGLFASAIGSMSDSIAVYEYGLWDYPNDGHHLTPIIADDLGIYLVAPYLFIQYLPKRRTFSRLFPYFLLWSLIALAIEALHVATGHMAYRYWWNLGWSYAADWVMYLLIYSFYRAFRLERLTSS